jgi:tRNA 2-thiouridine synthesizing protein A
LSAEATIVVDARGARCPWPVLRLARAAREAGPAATLRLIADDPRAIPDALALAAERGWQVLEQGAGVLTIRSG